MKVLFVAGAGRSGTTVLDMLLGGLPGFHSAGEIRQIWARGFMANERCSCGSAFADCDFWSTVAERAFGGGEAAPAARLRQIQRRIDHVWDIPLVRRTRPPGAFGRDLAEYREGLVALYGAAGQVADGIVVDSSKAASHAFILAGVPEIEVRVLHLVRDARAVAHSWTRVRDRPEAPGARMPRMGAPGTAAEWWSVNLSAEWLGRAGFPYARVRYEDLVRRPEEAVDDALARIGWRFVGGLPAASLGAVPEGARHLVSGNPVRFEPGPVVLRPDVEWEDRADRWRTIAVTSLTWPLLLRYGYALRAGGVERPRKG